MPRPEPTTHVAPAAHHDPLNTHPHHPAPTQAGAAYDGATQAAGGESPFGGAAQTTRRESAYDDARQADAAYDGATQAARADSPFGGRTQESPYDVGAEGARREQAYGDPTQPDALHDDPAGPSYDDAGQAARQESPFRDSARADAPYGDPTQADAERYDDFAQAGRWESAYEDAAQAEEPYDDVHAARRQYDDSDEFGAPYDEDAARQEAADAQAAYAAAGFALDADDDEPTSFIPVIGDEPADVAAVVRMSIPGLGLVGADGPRIQPVPGSIEEAMRAEVERPRPRPRESEAFEALHAWCRARTALVPSGFTIQVQVLDPAAPSYRFDLEPPEVDDPEFAADKLSGLLGDLWITEAAGDQGGWLFARIDAAGRTLRIDRWYDQVPDWWDNPVEPRLDVHGLVRRLHDRGPEWQPSYLERLYTTAR